MDRIIYGLYHPLTKAPVYIGKSVKGMDRPWTHIEEKSHSKKVNEWIKDLANSNQQPVIVILDTAADDIILDKKERFWINSMINDGYPLLNQTLINPVYFTLTSSYNAEDDYLAELRMFIKMKRKQCGLTQSELAFKAGIGLRFLRELEQGTKSNFNTDSIQKILNLFGAKLSVVKH